MHSGSTTEWNSASNSEYKLIDDVTIDSRVVVTGEVSVILAEGKTLTISKGIFNGSPGTVSISPSAVVIQD